MLPLPRVGGALSGALEESIAETGARVKRRVRVRQRPGRERCHLIRLLMRNPFGSHRPPAAELNQRESTPESSDEATYAHGRAAFTPITL
jgi:hypothetical protein